MNWMEQQTQCLYMFTLSLGLIYISTFYYQIQCISKTIIPFPVTVISKEMLHQALFFWKKKNLTLIHCFFLSFIKNQTNNL